MISRNSRSFGGRNSRPRNNYRSRGNRGAPKKQYINPDRFINKNVSSTEGADEYVAKHKFSDFDMHDVLKQNVAAAGFERPSAIQDQTIPLGLNGSDVIGLANTGTGKTAAFLLPILQKLNDNRVPQSVLIMAPTRELAQQIDNEFKKFSVGMRLYSAICVGGTSMGKQISQIRRRPHIIIGTPGRLKDLMGQGVLHLDNINTLVLDEADRMLDMGFVHDIREIVSQAPEDRQTLCFSATMSEGIKRIVNDFMRQPEIVSVKKTETADHIYQDVVTFDNDGHKKDLLLALLKQNDFTKVIVFGETKFGVQRLSDGLTANGISSRSIHGNKTQGQRNRALASFRSNEAKVLVATDVAARGLDIPSVSHVINFDQPQSYDDYVHRIGRTGRAGNFGIALTFVKR